MVKGVKRGREKGQEVGSAIITGEYTSKLGRVALRSEAEPGINEGKVGSRKELEYKIQTNTDRERYVFPPSPGNNTLQQCVCVSV